MRPAALPLAALVFLSLTQAAAAAPLMHIDAPSPERTSALQVLQAAGLVPAVAQDSVGFAVSAAGDVNGDGLSDFVVSAPGHNLDTGEVFILKGKANGTYALFQVLNGTSPSERFGFSVAAAGDVDADGYDDILIGAPEFNLEQGRFYLFRGGLAAAVLDTVIDGLAPDGHSTNKTQFGLSVAGAGDVNGDGYADVVVGAPSYTGPGAQSGISFVFDGGPGGITGPPTVLYGGVSGGLMGISVAGAGDLNGDGYDDIAIGEPSPSSFGKVLYFRGGASGIPPAAQDSVTSVAPTIGDLFGVSVSAAGDFDGDGYADVVAAAVTPSGAQLVRGASAGLSHTPTTLAAGPVGTVGCAGDVNGDGLGDVLVGLPNHNGPLGPAQGQAILCYGNRGSGGNANVILDGFAVASHFGGAVSGIGDLNADGFGDWVVGAPLEGSTGSYHVYTGGVAAPARYVSVSYAPNLPDGAPTNAHGGQSVSTSGDVNGDGFDDCVWGAPNGSVTVFNEGQAYIMMGSHDANFLNSSSVLHDGQASSRFGQSCSLAGDVNGDGYDDVLVGAPGYTSSFAQEGAAFLYLGQPSGLDSIPVRTWLGASPGLQWGLAVTGVGDVNRDGYADVAIASCEDATHGAHSGRVSIYLGGAGGPSLTSACDLFGSAVGDSLGFAIGPAGDVNGDGYDDVIVGAPGTTGGAGGFAILYGAAAPPFTSTFFQDFLGTSHIGWSVAGRGDIDGDGLADVVAGCPGYPDQFTNPDQGCAEFHLGTPTGLSPNVELFTDDVPGGRFGTSVSMGDLNGDGFCDLVVGAPFEDGPATDTGALHVYLATGIGDFDYDGQTALTKTQTYYGRRGTSVSASGDLNGDGLADIVDGAPYTFSELGSIEQAAGGGANFVRERIARQRRLNETAPISVGAATNGTGDFALHVRARTAAGRGNLSLQIQQGSITQAWSSLAVVPTSQAQTGAPGADGSYSDQVIAYLQQPAGSNLKWRMRIHTRSPYFPYSPWLTPARNASTLADLFVPSAAVAVGNTSPGTLALAPIEPNPSRGVTPFSFRLAEPGEAQLAIYDVAGRNVRTLDRARRPAGPATVIWDGTTTRGKQAPAGVYFARLTVGQRMVSREFVRF